MIKRLLNGSETKVHRNISQAIAGTSFTVFAQLPLKSVFDVERARTRTGDFKHYQEASFDFVIYDPELAPVLAIEFDGPVHERYQKKQRADIRKNRLCFDAGLPLLRITDHHLAKTERLTLLEFIVSRVVKWQQERDGLVAEMYRTFEEATEEECAALLEGGFLDPSVDPTFLFHLDHRFEGIHEVAGRLAKNFRIDCSEFSTNGKVEGPARYKASYGGRSEYFGDLNSHVETWLRLSPMSQLDVPQMPYWGTFAGEYTTPVWLPVEENWDRITHPGDYRNQFGKWPAYMNWLPGLSSNELSECVSEYLALKELEIWSQLNLS